MCLIFCICFSITLLLSPLKNLINVQWYFTAICVCFFSSCRRFIKDFVSKAQKFVTRNDECRHGWYVVFPCVCSWVCGCFWLNRANGKNREALFRMLGFGYLLIYILSSSRKDWYWQTFCLHLGVLICHVAYNFFLYRMLG